MTTTQRDHPHMPWSRTRPRSRRYGRDHRADRARHMAALEAAGAGLCAERVCVYRSRVITPDMDLDLCHDPSGTVVIGLGHRACNRREAAVRARAMQTKAHHRRTRLEERPEPRTDTTW